MAEQTKEEQIRDKICDRIINSIDENNTVLSFDWARVYETIFGKYVTPKKPPPAPQAGIRRVE